MSPASYVILGTAALCVGSGFWALRGHFVTVGGTPVGMRLLSLMTILGAGWFAADVLRDGVSRLWCLGLLAMAASLGIFWWAVASTRSSGLTVAFSVDEPARIVTKGPYAFIRHPFYTSYISFWIGTGVSSVSPYHWLVAVIALGAYWRAAVMEETKFKQSPVAADYAAYCQHAGMLFPHVSTRI